MKSAEFDLDWLMKSIVLQIMNMIKVKLIAFVLKSKMIAILVENSVIGNKWGILVRPWEILGKTEKRQENKIKNK